MSSDSLAICVTDLSKRYEIYDTPRDRLKQFVLPRLQRLSNRMPKQYFSEFWALKDVSFDVKKGETVGVIGRNGSGKSTLLQIICGTLNATSGSVETSGRIAALLELGSGFNPEFTGRENVYMNGALFGLSNAEIDTRFNDIIAFADIGSFIEQPVKTYSSGMLVRLAFAVAINVEPQILIVDEALSVGDELFQRKCFSRIEHIRNKGATILFVSHSGSAVIELCDHAILLDSGEKLGIGVPKFIVGKYQKLLYAPKDKVAAIRNEIISYSDLHPHKELSQQSRSHIDPSLIIADEDKNDPEEFFDPNLMPQSTLAYESNGAHIIQPEILTLSGKKVNYLKKGNKYRYTYKVKFDQGVSGVNFGMLIKTISGLEIGGATHAPSIGSGISYVPTGTTINVEFQFACNLNPGSYFLNAGVIGIKNNEAIYLHRVLDIIMFIVMPVQGNKATAIVDFECSSEIDFVDKDMKQIKER